MTDTPRPTAESPATEAGRALLDQGAPLGSTREWFAQDILAIEAEAAALSDSAPNVYAASIKPIGNCEWCGEPLAYTDKTGDPFCSEGRAVNERGVSPHKPEAALSDSALRKFVEFVADWAHDCNDTDLDAAGFSEPPDATFYGFDKVEKDARALLAQPTQAAEPSLDAAWKAAEKALPNERWRIGAVKRLNDGYWRAYAEGPIREGWTKFADGPTPTTALQFLATALTKP